MDNRHKTYVFAYSLTEDTIQNLEILKEALKRLRGYEKGVYGEYDKSRALDYILHVYEEVAENLAVIGELIEDTYEPYWDSEGNRPTHS